LIVVGASAQHFLVDHRNADHLTEEEDHLIRSRQAAQIAQIAIDDNAVEAVVYKNQQAAEQLCERLHRSSSLVLVSTTRS